MSAAGFSGHSARITGLFIYPVKSCRGIALKDLAFDANGPVNDRRWMIVDENNQFMTLRTFSKLAEIQTSVQGPFLHLYAGSNKILVNTTEECEQVEDVTIWGETFKAGIENKSINDALSDFLSKTVKLVRYQSQSFRDLGASATDVVKQTMFSDARPLLMTNTASLEELNGRLQQQGKAPSVMERFRSNMIIEGLEAFSEEQVARVTIQNSRGPVVLANPKLCGRCPVITQDVETGKIVSKETLATLAGYRRKEGSNKIPFGVYFVPEVLGTVSVGDEVVVEMA